MAEEVRRLAENAGGAAREIDDLITEIQAETRAVVQIVSDGAARTEEGTGTVEVTRDAFERIDAAIEKMHGGSARSPTPPRDVAAGPVTLQSDLHEVAGVAERSTAASEQVSAAAQQTTASTQRDHRDRRAPARHRGGAERLVSRFRLTALRLHAHTLIGQPGLHVVRRMAVELRPRGVQEDVLRRVLDVVQAVGQIQRHRLRHHDRRVLVGAPLIRSSSPSSSPRTGSSASS